MRTLPVLSFAVLIAIGDGLAAQRPWFAPDRVSLPPDVVEIEYFALGDLDGDGDLDAIATREESDRVWLNDGLGIFRDVTATHWPGDSATPNDAAVADLDGDGDLDVLVAELGGPLHLYANDGTGRFTDRTAAWIGSVPSFPVALATGDIDADGDVDLLVGHGGRVQDQLYRNDGTGRLVAVTATHLPVDNAVTFAAVLGDVDADGDLDALLGTLYGPTRLYRNDGSGRFTDVTATTMPADAGPTRAIGLGDIDGDGDPDIVLAESSASQNRCYVNDGGGTFTDQTATRLPVRADSTFDLALVDVDADGDLDLVLAEFSDPGRVLRNDGAGVFTDLAGAVPDERQVVANSLAIGDLDGDRDPDVLIADLRRNAEQWWNDGHGVFVDANPPVVELRSDEGSLDAAFADLDGDGDLDLAVGVGFPFTNQQNRCLLFEDGRFVDITARALPQLLDGTTAVATGDVDGDGDIDLLFGNWSTPQNRLLLNDGLANFVERTATHLPALVGDTEVIALGDVDGDGDLDAWIGKWNAPDDLLINDGAGRFAVAAPNVPAGGVATQGVALADVDGDGDLDALVVHHGSQDRLYLNDGRGLFTDVTSTRAPTSAGNGNEGAVGDLDGDGDLDAWISNDQQPDLLWIQDASGRFAAVSTGTPTGATDATLDVALWDLDEDGDLDAVLAFGADGVRVAWNDGAARFSLAESGATIADAKHVALADVDGDGDADLVAGSFFDFECTFNRLRHLASRGLPRVGKPLRLDVEGAANAAFVLDVALAPAWLQTPFGVLQIDPATIVAASPGQLDPTGRATITLPVPPLTTLIGLPLYWQAILLSGSQLHLTDGELTRFLGA